MSKTIFKLFARSSQTRVKTSLCEIPYKKKTPKITPNNLGESKGGLEGSLYFKLISPTSRGTPSKSPPHLNVPVTLPNTTGRYFNLLGIETSPNTSTTKFSRITKFEMFKDFKNLLIDVCVINLFIFSPKCFR